MIYIETLILIGILVNLLTWIYLRQRTEINIGLDNAILLFIILTIPFLFLGMYVTYATPRVTIHTTPKRARSTKTTKKRKKRK